MSLFFLFLRVWKRENSFIVMFSWDYNTFSIANLILIFNWSTTGIKTKYKWLQTFEFDGTQDQSLTVVFWPQVSGHTFVAATTAAGIVVRGLAYQDLALDVHRLCGSQELEGLKCETGIGSGASDVAPVGVVHGTAKGETETVLLD